MNRGQASIEALLILAAVLIAVASLQLMGESSSETTNAIAAVGRGVQSATAELAVQYGVEISISDWDLNGENIVFYLNVQGNPPPSDALMREDRAE